MTACVDKAVGKQRKWAMCAFWYGTYGCVEQRFAILEMMFLWEILRQFEIHPVSGLPPPRRRLIGGNDTGIKVHFVPGNDISVTSTSSSGVFAT